MTTADTQRGSVRKECFIIADPNGAGKTTFALKYLRKITSCNDYINVDEIAKGISPLNFEAGLIQASRIFLDLLNKKLRGTSSFAFETTLSGKRYLSRIPHWQGMGWKVVLIYLFIPSVKISEDRVRQRVEQGGHNVPHDDLMRRYPRSIANLFDYAKLCDKTYCFDNSKNRVVPIFESDSGDEISVRDFDRFAILKGMLP